MRIQQANYTDLSEILILQKLCYKENALRYNDFNIPPLTQSIYELKAEYKSSTIFKIAENSKIIASIRAFDKNNTCYIGRVIVHPDYQNKGLGKSLMNAIENEYNKTARFELFTGCRDKKNLSFYKKLGYKEFKQKTLSNKVSIVYFEKININ